jgi:RNase H-fold protein (predicted Holliday junction resolvase)
MKKASNLDGESSDEQSKNLPATTQNPAFAAAEMIVCGNCARANPPNRFDCLYCGAALEISEAQSQSLRPHSSRKLEVWEKGFNVILSNVSEDFGAIDFETIAALLKLETEIVRLIIAAKTPLPLAHVETESAAAIVQKRLRLLNLETKIVADEDLKTESAPRRLRGIEFYEDKLVLIFFNGDEILEIIWEDLILIVTGAIFERRVAGVESRGKRGGEMKLLETNETSSDEILFDIYSRADEIGYRVEQNGFDFSSCLAGADKSLLARENIRRLVEILTKRAPKLKLEEDYARVRAQLANVWAVDERSDAQGLKRGQFGKFSRENITIVSNAAQFTKYSRLQRFLI